MPRIKVIKNILYRNADAAEKNRSLLKAHNIFALNVMGSPGSGKTSLLEKTLELNDGKLRFAVIEGDLATSNDARRIARFRIPVVQINTQGQCHLSSSMVSRALKDLPLKDLDIIVIENVGNLVCPASFDLGVSKRVVVLGVTEGQDKVEKYPLMFRFADCCIINKIDIASLCGVSDKILHKMAHKVNQDLDIFHVSCRTGEGVAGWFNWLKAKWGQSP